MIDLFDPLASLCGYLAPEKSGSTRRCYAADFAACPTRAAKVGELDRSPGIDFAACF
jgi:hypothetical protein